MYQLCFFCLANIIPHFTLDNGIVIVLGDVGDEEEVAVEPDGLLTIHKPGKAVRRRVGGGLTLELHCLTLSQQAGLVGAGQVDGGGEPDKKEDGHRSEHLYHY